MKDFKVLGVKVTSNLEKFTYGDAMTYYSYVSEHIPPELTKNHALASIVVNDCGDGKVDVDYTLQGEKFERIRRITGREIAVCSQAD